MNRVFYFSGHRLTVFHWDGKKFQGACSFEPDYDGLSKFKEYLQSSSKLPARLLIDVIEEDFRTESIPHVYGKDKKAVIDRLLDRHYRLSKQYVYSEVIGRKESGRRDNKVLIGGVTNPALIDIWKDVIDECEIPLIGIWTLPLLSKSLIPLISEKNQTVLLVTQQVSSNLRQTFFRNGKMLSSRQSVINQDAEDISNIGEFAAPEIERTVAFLRNQRLINPGEVVHIHIIGSSSQLHSLQQEIVSDELNKVSIHNINELQDKSGLEGLSGKFSDGLFTWLCTKQLAYQAHYGEAKQYSQYYYALAAKAMKAASILVVLSALLITESNLSSAIEHKRSVELLGEQAQEYKTIYKRRFEAYETVFKHARSMNAAVDLAERIEKHAKTSPLDFMITLSEVLSSSGLNEIQLDKIEWKIEQYRIQGDIKEVNKDGVDFTSEDAVRHLANVHGRINVSDKNYRGSVAQVNKIITALYENERVEQVEALKMPVEVRSEKSFADESGLITNKTSKINTDGQFSIRVTMRAAAHE